MEDIHFSIDKPINARLDGGSYDVYIVGGFQLKANKNFDLRIGNAEKKVQVAENFLKTRCYKNWRRAIRYFRFKIEESGDYNISVKNTRDLEMRKSMLLSARLFQKPLSRDDIELIICRR